MHGRMFSNILGLHPPDGSVTSSFPGRTKTFPQMLPDVCVQGGGVGWRGVCVQNLPRWRINAFSLSSQSAPIPLLPCLDQNLVTMATFCHKELGNVVFVPGS